MVFNRKTETLTYSEAHMDDYVAPDTTPNTPSLSDLLLDAWPDTLPAPTEETRKAVASALTAAGVIVLTEDVLAAAVCQSEIAGSGHATGDIPCEWHTVEGNARVAILFDALRNGEQVSD